MAYLLLPFALFVLGQSQNDTGKLRSSALAIQDDRVLCGGHFASSCAECPRGYGAAWCHGDCVWLNNACVLQGPTPPVVSCGAHVARWCAQCAATGLHFCNGDCRQEGSSCVLSVPAVTDWLRSQYVRILSGTCDSTGNIDIESPSECTFAAAVVRGSSQMAAVDRSGRGPAGCYYERSDGSYLFSDGNQGASSLRGAPVLCRRAWARYSFLSTPQCFDSGMIAVQNASECLLAAATLGLKVTPAIITDGFEPDNAYPSGCYFRSSGTLYFNDQSRRDVDADPDPDRQVLCRDPEFSGQECCPEPKSRVCDLPDCPASHTCFWVGEEVGPPFCLPKPAWAA